MHARYMIEKPEDIQCTMKITMTLKHWGELRDQLERKWPSGELSGTITDLISQARQVFYAKEIEDAKE